MSAWDDWTPRGWCGSDEPHAEHWFRGFNGVDHNTVDIKCRGREAKPCPQCGHVHSVTSPHYNPRHRAE